MGIKSISLSEEKKNSNYGLFSKKLKECGISEVCIERLVTAIGEDNLINATYSRTVERGGCSDGALLDTILRKVAKYAHLINNLLPEDMRVDGNSLTKVALLHQISKAQMFSENDNEWEKDKRGIFYKFNELEGALRCGERSILLCTNAGITFSELEYEAMRIMDKAVTDEDGYSQAFSSAISVLIKQANEWASMELKKKAAGTKITKG